MYNQFISELNFLINSNRNLLNPNIPGFKKGLQATHEDSLKNNHESLIPSPHEFLDANYHSDYIKRFFIVAVVVLLGLLLLFVNRYLAKRSLSKILKDQCDETALSNENLSREKSSLLKEKGNLIEQKEWLLAEIHHRVRNNLHTIVSLMESQAVYLKNDALTALEKSQHRIYAMSLIHQNMYCDEYLQKVDIENFIDQLSRYIKGSYPSENPVNIQLDIDPVKVNMTQAIPLALIINEVITNAVLHAFDKTKTARILVSMHEANDLVKLIISDNGIGIDVNENHNPSDTLGMVLINGLSEDINGEIIIESKQGTKVSLVFPVEYISDKQLTQRY